MKLELTVTAIGNIGIYSLKGPAAITHQAATTFVSDPLIQATTKGLRQIPWLSYIRKANDGLSKDLKLRLTFYTDSPELIEAGAYMADLEDPSGLPPHALELWEQLKKFEVRWHRTAGELEQLKSFGATIQTN